MASLNDPTGPMVRQPRMKVTTNGAEIPGLIRFDVQSNCYFQASTFSAEFAASASAQLTQGQQDAATQYDLDWWGEDARTGQRLDISASVDGGDSWKSLIVGVPDRLTIDPVSNVVLVEGRDLTALLVDEKIRQTYQNRTASQVATELAGKHGLTPDVTETTTLIGRYYSDNHDHITLDSFSSTTSEWELLTFLAQSEGFDVWVDGATLHFHPPAASTSPPYDVVIDRTGEFPSSNAVSIRMQRSLAFSKDVVVAVRSWNSRSKRAYTVFSPSQERPQVASGRSQQFSYIRPNLTPAQAQDLANRLREDISRQERLGTFRMPGDVIPSPRDKLRLRGTNSSWDALYYVAEVHRQMGLRGGFTQTIHVKNHNPQTTVATP